MAYALACSNYNAADPMRFRLNIVFLLTAISMAPLVAQDGQKSEETDEEASDNLSSNEKLATETKSLEKTRKARSGKGLSKEEQLEWEKKLLGNDLKHRGDVAYLQQWSFKSGVTRLNTPYYDGWINLIRQKGAIEDFSEGGDPNDLLAGVLVNKNYVEASGSDFINFYSLVWVPQDYAFSLFSQSNFDNYKSALREYMIDQRKLLANRDDFESFDDYIRFKFGRDEEMESFADGYMIEASESDGHLTYFFTFEARRKDKKQEFVSSMVGTLSYFLVRNKLIKVETRMEYNSIDDISRILEFSDRFREDFVLVNGSRK